MDKQTEGFRLLLVDDEHLERQSIKLILKQNSAPFYVLAEAKNGKEALRLAGELKPDIILQDIKMPGMDGLTAAREIKKILPDVVIIFLTAYDEFVYAKEALQAGAADYLLKPVPTRDLLEALEKARKLILHERSKREEQKRLQEQLKEALPWLRVNLGVGLMFGSWEEKSALEQQAAVLQLKVLPQVALSVQMEDRPQDEGSVLIRLDWLRYRMQQVIEESLNHFPYGICLPVSEKMLMVLWGSDEPGPENRLRQLAEHIMGAVSEELSLEVTVGMGSFCEDVEQMPRSVWEAQTAAHLGMFYFGPGKLVSMNELGIGTWKIGDSYPSKEKEMVEALRNGNMEGTLPIFRELMGSISRGQSTDIYMVKARLMNILARFAESTGWIVKGDKEQDYFEFARRLELCRSLEEMEKWLVELTEKAGQIFSNKISGSSNLVKKVLAYIQENYHRELSLAELSRVIYLSPDYFSRVFKEHTGCSFSEYILNLRVEKAKALLADTDLPVGEVGKKAGYPDSNYFSRVFGRAVGVSPSRYRQEVVSSRNSKKISCVW